MVESGGNRSDEALLQALDGALAQENADPLSALANLLTRGRAAPGARGMIELQGERAGPYELTRLVGLGGMGATYEAVDDQNEKVAVKIVGTVSEH